jgi:hypothetical protein
LNRVAALDTVSSEGPLPPNAAFGYLWRSGDDT